jgi:hypothetical protein
MIQNGIDLVIVVVSENIAKRWPHVQCRGGTSIMGDMAMVIRKRSLPWARDRSRDVPVVRPRPGRIVRKGDEATRTAARRAQRKNCAYSDDPPLWSIRDKMMLLKTWPA